MGSTGISLTLRVQNVQLLGTEAVQKVVAVIPGGASQGSSQAGPARMPSASDVNEPIDDLPF